MIALKGVPCACDLHDISYIVSYVHMIVMSFLILTDYSTFSNISANVMEIFGKSFSVTTVSALYCSVLTPFSHMFDPIFTPFLREIM